jgi:hypothetical protein
MTINRPIPFSGSEAEKRANYASHMFITWDEETHCSNCDCKPWHKAAYYPCGTNPPRETVEVGS